MTVLGHNQGRPDLTWTQFPNITVKMQSMPPGKLQAIQSGAAPCSNTAELTAESSADPHIIHANKNCLSPWGGFFKWHTYLCFYHHIYTTLHFLLLNSFDRWLWLTLPFSFRKMWMIIAVLPTSWGCCQHTEGRFLKDWFAFYHVACNNAFSLAKDLTMTWLREKPT